MLGVHIFAKHSMRCLHRSKGRAYMRCGCPLWVDGYDGKCREKSLHTRDIQEATERLTIYRGIGGGPKAKEVPAAIKAWDDYCVSKYIKPATLRKYRRVMGYFQKWCNANGHDLLLSVTVEDLDKFRNARGHLEASSSSRELQIFRGFFSYCHARKWTDGNPAKQIQFPKVPPNEKDPYTDMEMTAILSACDLLPHEYERSRARAMILVLRYTGLRISDVIKLRKDRIINGEISLYTQKTGTPVILPLPGAVLGALAALPEPLGAGMDCPYYFWHGNGGEHSLGTRAHRLLHSVFKRSGVKGAHCHRFRHTLASAIMAGGGMTDDVAVILGISPAIAKKHYIKWTVARQQKTRELMMKVNNFI